MCAKRRIALYGGTFDPVHLGHLEVARKVSELFEIEKVLFLPAQVAPHKLGKRVTDPIHRYAMLVLATQDEPKLAVSTFEIEAADRRYTVDTVEHFIGTLGDTSELFFIMGADSWVEITTWRDWKRLLTMVNHIVVTRPGYDLVGPVEVKDQIVDLRSSDGPVWNEQQGPRIYLTDVVMNDVSATEIRSLAGKCQYENLAALLSQPVVKYLEKYGIYQESNED
jgi:nicotinate-nucleotide adenylyltransferase